MSLGITEILIIAGVSLTGAAIVALLAYLLVSMPCSRKESEPQPSKE
jgi:hypothetical protein